MLKKITALSIALIMLCSLAGCGESVDTQAVIDTYNTLKADYETLGVSIQTFIDQAAAMGASSDAIQPLVNTYNTEMTNGVNQFADLINDNIDSMTQEEADAAISAMNGSKAEIQSSILQIDEYTAALTGEE